MCAASRGLLDAAHFCYLMAQTGFGVYTRKTTKLVLIGSNHRCAARVAAASALLEGVPPAAAYPALAGRTQGQQPHGVSRGVMHSGVKIARVLNSLPFLKFATNEAIQRTEAYEYAQSLGAQSGPLPNFQVSPRLRGTADRRSGLWPHVRVADLLLETFQLYSAR